MQSWCKASNRKNVSLAVAVCGLGLLDCNFLHHSKDPSRTTYASIFQIRRSGKLGILQIPGPKQSPEALKTLNLKSSQALQNPFQPLSRPPQKKPVILCRPGSGTPLKFKSPNITCRTLMQTASLSEQKPNLLRNPKPSTPDPKSPKVTNALKRLSTL